MEINTQPQPAAKSPGKDFLRSNTARIIMVGVLTLVLLIPLQYVKGLITERSQFQRKVENNLASQWGGGVYLYGPVLKVPYRSQQGIEYAYIFPDKLGIDANVQSESRRRSIYERAVFNAKIKFKGEFSLPTLCNRVAPENVDWNGATFLLNTGSPKSIRGIAAINANGKTYTFEPAGSSNDSTATLETSRFSISDVFSSGKGAFSLDMSYDGSNSFERYANWQAHRDENNVELDTSTIRRQFPS